MVWAVKTFLHTSDQCTLGDNKSTGLPLHLQEASACSSLEFPCRTVTSFLHVGLYNLGILSWLEICHVESGVSIRAPPTSSDPPLYNILQRRVNRHAPPLLLAFFRHMCFYLWRRLIWPSWHFPHCSVQWISVFFSRYKGLRALCRIFGGEVLKLLHFDISGWVSSFFFVFVPFVLAAEGRGLAVGVWAENYILLSFSQRAIRATLWGAVQLEFQIAKCNFAYYTLYNKNIKWCIVWLKYWLQQLV